MDRSHMGQDVLIIGFRGFRLRRFLGFGRLTLARRSGAVGCRLFVATLVAAIAAALFLVRLGRCL